MAETENQVRARKLAAQAEEKLAPLVTAPLSTTTRELLEARMKTAMHLYPVLEPIAQKHGVPVEELIALHIVETRGERDPMGRTSTAKASGPFQLTPIARRQYPASARYETQVETDADSAAQYLKAARDAGFTMPEAVGMTYIAGIEGVRRWAGGDDNSGVGKNSKAYGPMFRYTIERVKTETPIHLKSLDRPARAAGVDAMNRVLQETPAPKMETGLKGFFFGPSEEEFEAARKARADEAEAARKRAYEEALPEMQTSARKALSDLGYK